MNQLKLGQKEEVELRAFLFVYEVEPMNVGETYQTLPLHCTLMHWFRTTSDIQNIISIAKRLVEHRQSVELESNGPELFGVNCDIPVNTLVVKSEMLSMHGELLKSLDELGIVPTQPQFIGAAWRPHVTTKDGMQFSQGKKIKSKVIYLIEALNPEKLSNKKVIEKFVLR